VRCRITNEVKRLVIPLLVVLLGGLLTGCAGGSGKQRVTGTTSKGQVSLSRISNGGVHSSLVVATKPARLRDRAPRLLSPTRLAIATIGSTECPTVPKRLTVQSSDAIQIQLEVKTPPNGNCLADAHLTRYVISINPSQINVHHRLTIRLDYPKGVVSNGTRPVVVRAAPL
jgi:hypothetical protein